MCWDHRKMATRISLTVSKALDIFDALIEQERNLTITELSSLTSINKSTMVRLCATLEGRGYLQRSVLSGYQLGAKTTELARIYRDQFQFESLVRPMLADLRDKTGESTSFYIRDGDICIVVYRENTFHALGHFIAEGTRLPIHEGVVGKVLLAFSGEKGKLFDAIRADGYLESAGATPHVHSISAPILADGAIPFGAIVVSGLSSRFTRRERKKALPLILKVCQEISAIIPQSDLSHRSPGLSQ